MSIIPDYLEYIYQNKVTYLPELYGCYSFALKDIIPFKRVKFYIIIMKNITPNYNNFIRFDLKGSSVNRGSGRMQGMSDLYVELGEDNIHSALLKADEKIEQEYGEESYKDNDFSGDIILFNNDYAFMKKTFLNDTKFLLRHNIMDYSLLLAVPKSDIDIENIPENLKSNICKDIEGNIYFFGIIDVFQKWTMSKAFESQFKNVFEFHNRYEVSSIDPDQYYHRFYEKVFKRVFNQIK